LSKSVLDKNPRYVEYSIQQALPAYKVSFYNNLSCGYKTVIDFELRNYLLLRNSESKLRLVQNFSPIPMALSSKF